MYNHSENKRVLTEIIGATAVMELVEKRGEDAVDAVFGMMVESSNWSVKESYEYTMANFEGVFEEPSDYLASLYSEHMHKALTSYSEQHLVSWPVELDDMMTEFNWDAIAEHLNGRTFFAYQTLFEDESKQYFIFKASQSSD